MSAHKISVAISGRDLAHRLAGAMQDLVIPAPEALTLFEAPAVPAAGDAWRIEAYFAEPPDPDAWRDELESLIGEPLPNFEAGPVPDLNWVAISQSALPPVFAGRFVVHGSHDRARTPQGPNAILIEAGEAFGTAHHATTYGCLLALDRLTRRKTFKRILDLGCGSGVLAIALARALPHARITASDLDRQSVEVARANMRANRVGGRIRAIRAAGLDAPELRRVPGFDLIVANILAGPLIALAPKIAGKLAAGKLLLLSGILIPQAPAVIAAYRTQGFAVRSHDRIAGWSTLVFVKRGVAPRRSSP